LQKIDFSSSRIADAGFFFFFRYFILICFLIIFYAIFLFLSLGILHFLEKLEFFENIRSIKSTDNFISEKIEKILLEILEKNKSLTEFAVNVNRLSLCFLNRVKKIL
jgi:hypothetical protein